MKHPFRDLKLQFNGEVDQTPTPNYEYPMDWYVKLEKSVEKYQERAFEKGIVEDPDDVIVHEYDLPSDTI